jgi:hypothetical protein
MEKSYGAGDVGKGVGGRGGGGRVHTHKRQSSRVMKADVDWGTFMGGADDVGRIGFEGGVGLMVDVSGASTKGREGKGSGGGSYA